MWEVLAHYLSHTTLLYLPESHLLSPPSQASQKDEQCNPNSVEMHCNSHCSIVNLSHKPQDKPGTRQAYFK